MTLKILLVTIVLYVVSGEVFASPGLIRRSPVAKSVVVEQYDANPQYSYGYQVQDDLTGDSKGHKETRNRDVVRGSYSVADPDGFLRIVDYTADSIHGFNAVVRRTPLSAQSRSAAVVRPIVSPPIYRAALPVVHATGSRHVLPGSNYITKGTFL